MGPSKIHRQRAKRKVSHGGHMMLGWESITALIMVVPDLGEPTMNIGRVKSAVSTVASVRDNASLYL